MLEGSLFEFMKGAPQLYDVVSYMKGRGYVAYDIVLASGTVHSTARSARSTSCSWRRPDRFGATIRLRRSNSRRSTARPERPGCGNARSGAGRRHGAASGREDRRVEGSPVP